MIWQEVKSNGCLTDEYKSDGRRKKLYIYKGQETTMIQRFTIGFRNKPVEKFCRRNTGNTKEVFQIYKERVLCCK